MTDAVRRTGLTTRQIDAWTTAFAAWLAATVAFALHFDNAWWAAISAWMVMNIPERHAVLVKGLMRVIGTIIGVTVAYFIAVQIEGIAALQVLVLGGAVTLGCYQRHRAEYAYAWFIGFLMIAMLTAESLQQPTALVDFAYYRVYEIITGVGVATALMLCARPLHQAAGTTHTAAKPPDEKKLLFACLFAGGVAVLIVALWQVYSIPSVFQVLVTITAVQFPDLAETRKMALNRLAGCILGGVAGLLMVSLASEAYALWSLTFALGLYGFSFIHHGGSKTIHPYIGTQAGMAFIIAMVTANGPSDTILPVLERLIGIFVAFLIIGVLAYVVEPWVRFWTEGRAPAA